MEPVILIKQKYTSFVLAKELGPQTASLIFKNR